MDSNETDSPNFEKCILKYKVNKQTILCLLRLPYLIKEVSYE